MKGSEARRRIVSFCLLEEGGPPEMLSFIYISTHSQGIVILLITYVVTTLFYN